MTNDNQNKSEGAPACNRNDNPTPCCCGSGKWIWIVLAVAVAAVLIAQQVKRGAPGSIKENSPAVNMGQILPGVKTETGSMEKIATAPASSKSLPRLVDLGATKCIPCKMMAPILEDLKKTQADKFEVQFIDVWQNPDPGRKYGIRLIPTQIFFAPDGKELFRHEGFYGKEDILAKWKELGF